MIRDMAENLGLALGVVLAAASVVLTAYALQLFVSGLFS